MDHAWTLAEVAVTADGRTASLEEWQADPVEAPVDAVACGYCGAALGFEEGGSGRPADCAVHPGHDCPNLPPEPDPAPDGDVAPDTSG